ncbi:MAG: NrsF family protein [Alphaproteobacteria bacterium]|nr:NrsF family protein [Alphaproteobacteria bacterium]
MKQGLDSDKLIETLSDELGSVTPLAPPLRRAALWALAGIVYLGLFWAVAGVRQDFATIITPPSSVLYEVIMAAFIGLSAILASAWLCVPEGAENRRIIIPPIAGFILFCLWVAYRSFSEPMDFSHAHWDHCLDAGIMMGFIPSLSLVMLSRRGATTAPYLMALMNFLAIAALGFIGLRLNCGVDSVEHAIFTHLLPFTLVGLLAGLFARKLYRW